MVADVLARFHRQRGCRRLLPDRHGRARAEGRAGRAKLGISAAGALRPHGRALRRALGEARHQQRRLHPHHRAAARARRAGIARRTARARRDLQGRLRGLVLRPGRALLDRQGRRGRALPGLRAGAGPPRRGELLLPHGQPPRVAARAHRGQPRVHPARVAPQRDARFPAPAPRRPVHLPAEKAPGLGHRAALRPGVRDLRLVRRADQLHHRAGLRHRGPALRALLARGAPPHRQGHPHHPRGVLADDAPRRRDRAAAHHLRPRLVDHRGAQDVEVDRQRRRPGRSRGPLRRRSPCATS